ncbi:hypothetical protein PAMA_015844 [Pampus argenteus]
MDSDTNPALRHRGETGASSGSLQSDGGGGTTDQPSDPGVPSARLNTRREIRTWAPRESGRWRGTSCGCRCRAARGPCREVWLGNTPGILSAETTRRGEGGGGGGGGGVVVEKMSASVGPQGGPRPPTATSMPDLPDLSHLTEEERKIIMAVMARQKEEEEKEQAMLKLKQHAVTVNQDDPKQGQTGVDSAVRVGCDSGVGVWLKVLCNTKPTHKKILVSEGDFRAWFRVSESLPSSPICSAIKIRLVLLTDGYFCQLEKQLTNHIVIKDWDVLFRRS